MIYLDNAATTFPKPRCMTSEICRCINEYCGNPGRSGHKLSLLAAEKIYQCRESLANFFGSSQPENIVFTLNTTYALNTAIKSLYRKDSHILISNMEHNSVFRPIHNLSELGHVKYSVFNAMQSTREILSQLQSLVRYNTDMLVMTHASNICGKVFPIKEIGNFCKNNNLTFIVDAAQSAGNVEIDIEEFNIDALCAPAHKGLYGPQGLGFILFGNNRTPTRTIIEGGNGTNSVASSMGTTLPEALEAGTLPTPLIAGLDASLKWIQNIGISNINNHEKELALALTERLSSIPNSVVFEPYIPETGIVLYSNRKHSQNRIYDELNHSDICTRNGLHCAPLAHKTLGTLESGAIRFSFGYFNNIKEIDQVYKVIRNVI